MARSLTMLISRRHSWGVALLICGGCLFAHGCRKHPRAKPRPKPKHHARRPPGAPPLADESKPQSVGRLRVESGQLSGYDDDGSLLWRARADTLLFDDANQRATLENAVCEFYEGEALQTRCQAGRIKLGFSEGDDQLTMTGGVTASSVVSGVEARSETARWNWRDRRLVQADQVIITRGNITLQGERLEADTALKEITVMGARPTMSLGGDAP